MSGPGRVSEPTGPLRLRASRTSLSGSVRRGIFHWRDAVKGRDIAIAIVIAVLAIGLGALVAARDRALHEVQVLASARRLQSAIAAELERPVDALVSLRSLYLAVPNVTRRGFRDFVVPLLERPHNRSIYALEWMPIVPASERDAYEAEGRTAGLKNYRFWAFDESKRRVALGARPAYGPIQFMEPPSLQVLGFDIMADALRWPTAQWARDTGLMAASRPFSLLEDTDKSIASIAVYMPVFQTPDAPASQAARSAALRGFLLAVFRVHPLVDAATSTVSTEGLRFALWDRTEQAEAPDRLVESYPGATEDLSRLEASGVHDFETPLANRRWQLRVASTKPAALAANARGAWIAILGVLFAGVAFCAVTALRAIVRLRRQVERVGPYTLVGRLGRGAMGVVYEARHALLRRPTAIKLLAPGVAGDRALARFEREVQLTAALTHPSTIAIYDYGRTGEGVFYYAMELLRGVNLQQLVTIDGPLPPGRVVRLLAQACGALAEAHAAGLIHRDVKPANMMVCVLGGIPDFLKVLDFGLVKDIGGGEIGSLAAAGTGASAPPFASSRGSGAAEDKPVAVSQDGSLLGTPLFLAPEGVTNPGAVDARLDVYALGAVAYFLLTGETPFPGATAIEIYARQRKGAPPPLMGPGGSAIPEALSAVVIECLAFRPDDRPSSCLELARRLASSGVAPWRDDECLSWWSSRGPEVERAARAAREAAGEAGTITTGARRLAPARRTETTPRGT